MVDIIWDAKSTFWDFDRLVGSSIPRFEKTSWPLRIVTHHICCSPKLVAMLMKPIFFGGASKFTRTRTLLHDVPESEIVGVLEKYGILDSMLPTYMGGKVEFSQSEWIAQRRAAEMEEL